MVKPKCDRIVGVFFLIALITGFFYSLSWAADRGPGRPGPPQAQQIGEVRRIQGTALIRHGGEERFQPIRENTPILVEDTVAADRASKAWCVVSPGSSNEGNASLGEDSALYFVRLERNQAFSAFSGDQGQGLIRYIKRLPQTNPPSSFVITTQTAVIQVVPSDRASDFVIEVVNENLTTVYGIWGAVSVRNIADQFTQERIVRSCQKVNVERDKEPSPVMGVSPEKLKELIKRTTIPNTLPEEVPSCRPEVTEEYGEEPLYLEEVPILGCPCPPGEVLVGDVCRRCPPSKLYDPSTCSCVSRCRNDGDCPRCERCRDGKCLPIVCPPGEWLDRETCRCRRRCPQTIHCKEGYWFNPKTCRCERRCEIRECPQGQWLDKENCQCVGIIEKCRKTCPPGQTLDPDTCMCKPKCTKTCPPHEWLDYNTCQCRPRCQKTCPPGHRLNRETCTCEREHECNITCPAGQRVDREKCRCVPETILKKEGCTFDSDCGPGFDCRDGRCIARKEHIEQPFVEPKHKPEIPKHLIEPIQPSRPVLPPGRQFQVPGQQIR
jgi:hypothetical protein